MRLLYTIRLIKLSHLSLCSTLNSRKRSAWYDENPIAVFCYGLVPILNRFSIEYFYITHQKSLFCFLVFNSGYMQLTCDHQLITGLVLNDEHGDCFIIRSLTLASYFGFFLTRQKSVFLVSVLLFAASS